ncbi:Pyruvate/Phosphoenolpyruvate kinase-like domain-containing protein [Infundibulicybe gibba]|nr:Pyruvate/Phosphoenolpyruvate kinase-like domain-containing protein [Infundibulicybe gibba]
MTQMFRSGAPSVKNILPLHGAKRCLSSEATLRRSYLYVPSSSERMLQKSLASSSDMIIYDLEDSVSPVPERLHNFLNLPSAHRVAVRVNDITTPFFRDDMLALCVGVYVVSGLPCRLHTRVAQDTSPADLHHVSKEIHSASLQQPRSEPLRIVPSIESARGLWNLGGIAGWQSEHGAGHGGVLSALLFAAEDYCADTSIIRTPSRRELLYTRSQIVIAAKAFGLGAIDMVGVWFEFGYYVTDNNDPLGLRQLQGPRVPQDECEDGRQLGFTGKQAIHPSQVDIIQSTFVPTSKILREMQRAHASEKGAVGLEGEMIDAPMLKQAESTIRVAKAAGLEIPSLD